MENFFSWVSKPLSEEEVEVWLNMNNILQERGELYYDFCLSLYLLIKETYLGEEQFSKETKILMSEEEKLNHFSWCWKKTLENFKKENINFKEQGEHFEYFGQFFLEIYYNQKNEKVKNSIDRFFKDLFDREVPFTKSDLELFTEVYKLLDKNLVT
jgi:hypothetical protein